MNYLKFCSKGQIYTIEIYLIVFYQLVLPNLYENKKNPNNSLELLGRFDN